jgi:hypothetical protein
VVDRAFSWFGRNRRLAKDFENLALATFVTQAMRAGFDAALLLPRSTTKNVRAVATPAPLAFLWQQWLKPKP